MLPPYSSISSSSLSTSPALREKLNFKEEESSNPVVRSAQFALNVSRSHLEREQKSYYNILVRRPIWFKLMRML